MTKRVARDKYVGPDGLTIVLEVPEPPMGFASGYIPPPSIAFFRSGQGVVTFTYAGTAADDERLKARRSTMTARAGDDGRYFLPSWKPAPVEVRWRHMDDCRQAGCPGHIARFAYNSTSDTFTIQFDTESDERIYLDGVQLWMLGAWLDYMRSEDAEAWAGALVSADNEVTE